MNKEQREKIIREKIDSLNSAISNLEREVAMLQSHREEKIDQLTQELEDLKLQKEIFTKFKIK